MICDTIIELYQAYADSDLFGSFSCGCGKIPGKCHFTAGQVSDHLGETRMLLSVFKDTGDTVDSLLEMVQKTLDKSSESLA